MMWYYSKGVLFTGLCTGEYNVYLNKKLLHRLPASWKLESMTRSSLDMLAEVISQPSQP